MERKAVADFSDGMRQGDTCFLECLDQKDVMDPGQWSRQGTMFEGGYEDKEVMDFHRRVRQGYLELAKREPERWFTIDARLSPQEVSGTHLAAGGAECCRQAQRRVKT